MFKKILYPLIIIIFSNFSYAQSIPIDQYHPLDNMPISEPHTAQYGSKPIAQRGEEFKKFLSASLKISVNGSSGSGTIIFYDKEKNLAYVATCGHLWSSGVLTAEQAKLRNITATVTTWYHNDKKLSTPKSYGAKLMFYSYISGQDTGLMTFTPDWEPNYFPIAPRDYVYKKNKNYHSIGSDHGSEAAHYDIEALGIYGNDLVTTRNSPRPGRSGGGLIDDQMLYIGTCWGTQFVDGTGRGYFTPLSAIHRFWSQQKDFAFLLNIKRDSIASKLQIIDRNNKQGKYSNDYIILPKAG